MTKPETIICEIYDAWRAQDLEWLASYLPDDFCHIIYIPRFTLWAAHAAAKRLRSRGSESSPTISKSSSSIPAA